METLESVTGLIETAIKPLQQKVEVAKAISEKLKTLRNSSLFITKKELQQVIFKTSPSRC